ncbi:MAG: hypothetical protein ACI9NC_005411, partial [Verrucomicrobiales bacterium]
TQAACEARQEARAQSAEEARRHRHSGHDPALVPQADREEV